MTLDFFEKLHGYKDNIPNKFTIALGELIRKARNESGMTQAELAERAYFSQTAISQIEQGKRDVSAAEILYLGYAMNKPVLYFFQYFIPPEEKEKVLSPLENELIIYTRKLSSGDLRKLIAQTKALANLADQD
jgi:transcriptional regulator with XRE-family HTH domain